jgi:hypothetical protein
MFSKWVLSSLISFMAVIFIYCRLASHNNARARCTVFDYSNTGIVVSNPNRGIDIRPRFACICSIVCRKRPCNGRSPVQSINHSNQVSKNILVSESLIWKSEEENYLIIYFVLLILSWILTPKMRAEKLYRREAFEYVVTNRSRKSKPGFTVVGALGQSKYKGPSP